MEEEEGKGEEPKKGEGTANPTAAGHNADTTSAKDAAMGPAKDTDVVMSDEPPEVEPTEKKIDLDEVVRNMQLAREQEMQRIKTEYEAKIMAAAINKVFHAVEGNSDSAGGHPETPASGGSSRSDGRPDPPALGGVPGPPAGILAAAGVTRAGKRTPLTPDEAILAQYELACSTSNRSEWQTFGRQVATLPEDAELALMWNSGDNEQQCRAFRIWLSKAKSAQAASMVITTRTNRYENTSKVVKHMTLDVALRCLVEPPYLWSTKYIEQVKKFLDKNKNFEKCPMSGEKVYAWPVERTTTEGNLKENLSATRINAEPTVGSNDSMLALGGSDEAPALAIENEGVEGATKGKGKGKTTKEKNPATNALKTLKDPWGSV